MATQGPLPPTLAPSRLGAPLALGATLATRGWLVKGAMLLAVPVVLIAIALCASRHGSTATLMQLPAAASSALAWGVGVPIAFAASTRAFREDHARGIRALLHARGTGPGGYATLRVLGLALVIFAVVGGGTLISGAVATLTAPARANGGAAEGMVSALVFALAFALVMSPLALAAIGGRSRAGGYLGLLMLLVLPEILERWTASLAPPGWGDVLSVPSALAALRSSLAPGEGLGTARFARAFVVLAAFAAACFALARLEIARVDASTPEAPG